MYESGRGDTSCSTQGGPRWGSFSSSVDQSFDSTSPDNKGPEEKYVCSNCSKHLPRSEFGKDVQRMCRVVSLRI